MSTIFLRSLIFVLLASSSLLAQTKIREGSQTTGALPTSQGGVPNGGLTDQVLSKINGTDYNYQWVDPSGGEVDSVFTRTGNVIATTGDYVAAQVTNAVDTTNSYSNPIWITALVWSKITSTPTTVAGYGITDFNSLGDARWVLKNGSITGATKTKVTYDAKGLTTSGADATTADIADSSDKRYVTDAQLVVIGNTSGTNTGDQVVPVNTSTTASQYFSAYNATTGAFTKALVAESDVTNLVSDLALKAPLASPTLTGNPAAPTQSSSDNSTKLATTAYVTTGISNAVAGVNPAIAVQAATTAAGDTSGLTYSNGVGGIGATFTGSNNTALTFDGYTFTAVGQRALVKDDTQSPSGAFNGMYYVTQIQTAILPPILTRALDYNQPGDINNTGAIPVMNGTVNLDTSWLLTSNVTTVGTDPLTYIRFSLNPTTIITSAGDLSPLFTTSESSNNIAFALSNAAAQTVFGNNTGSSAGPAFSSSPQFLKIGNLTSNGFVKTSGGDGTLSTDTSTYLTSSSISDTAFGSSWNTVTTIAPSKNAVYDEIHLFDTADDGTILNAGTGFRIAGAAGSNKILKSNGTNFVASTETYAAPGTSGNVLTSDGTNWTSAAGGGNPTASVGISATNGSASTFLRSDGAPALSQAITPAWTGQHTFSEALTIASATSAVWDDVNLSAQTTTVTGTTAITTTKGFNKVSIYKPTVTDSSSVTITRGATLYIEDAPAVSGSASFTDKYALWVDNGRVRFDLSLNVGGTADPGSGVINANSGYTVGGAAPASGTFMQGSGVVYSASTFKLPASIETSGKILQSNGTDAVFSTPTWPTTAGTSRKIVVSDGTNLVSSTETWAVPGTSGKTLRSDGTNWTSTTQQPNGLNNGNAARQSQAVSSGTAYYITNSGVTLPATALTAMTTTTRFVWRVHMDKTNAGTGTFQIIIYRGTNGSTSDTADVTQTIGTQTAVVDNMMMDVMLTVTTTGGTGAYFWSICPIHQAATATGFGIATGTTGLFTGTVSSVAMNTSSLIFGLGFKATTGTPTITVPFVDARAINID